MAGVRTELFHVSSDHGTPVNPDDPTNAYTFKFPHKLRNVRHVAVQSLEWGNGVYNVNNLNSITIQLITYPNLPLLTNPTVFERKLSVPAGSYDLTLLVDALNVELARYPETQNVVTAGIVDLTGAIRFEAVATAQKGLRIAESSYIFGGISRQSQSNLLDSTTQVGIQSWNDSGIFTNSVTYVEAVKPINLLSQRVIFLWIPELDRVNRHMYGHDQSSVNRSGIVARFQTLNVDYAQTVFVKADETQTYGVDVGENQCLDLTTISVIWMTDQGEQLNLHHVPNSFLLKISYTH